MATPSPLEYDHKISECNSQKLEYLDDSSSHESHLLCPVKGFCADRDKMVFTLSMITELMTGIHLKDYEPFLILLRCLSSLVRLLQLLCRGNIKRAKTNTLTMRGTVCLIFLPLMFQGSTALSCSASSQCSSVCSTGYCCDDSFSAEFGQCISIEYDDWRDIGETYSCYTTYTSGCIYTPDLCTTALCDACPAGTTASGSSCVCSAGYSGSGSTCKMCAAGTYSSSTGLKFFLITSECVMRTNLWIPNSNYRPLTWYYLFAGAAACAPCPTGSCSSAGAIENVLPVWCVWSQKWGIARSYILSWAENGEGGFTAKFSTESQFEHHSG